MDIDYLKIIVTVIVAVIGWIIGHYFTTRRDVSLKRREISLGHLINAYRILTNDVSHRPGSKEGDQKLEIILSDIQLFGTQEQVRLAKELIEIVAAGGKFPLDPLINDLRNDLREQIGLSKIEGNIKWLRFNNDK